MATFNVPLWDEEDQLQDNLAKKLFDHCINGSELQEISEKRPDESCSVQVDSVSELSKVLKRKRKRSKKETQDLKNVEEETGLPSVVDKTKASGQQVKNIKIEGTQLPVKKSEIEHNTQDKKRKIKGKRKKKEKRDFKISEEETGSSSAVDVAVDETSVIGQPEVENTEKEGIQLLMKKRELGHNIQDNNKKMKRKKSEKEMKDLKKAKKQSKLSAEDDVSISNKVIMCEDVSGISKQPVKMKKIQQKNALLKDNNHKDNSLGTKKNIEINDLDASNNASLQLEEYPPSKTKRKSNASDINELSSDLSIEDGKGRKLATNLKHTSSLTLRDKLKKKLNGAQFRWINEQLYTTESDKSFSMFKENPSLFDVYHRGFQSQVELWPENPVDLIIEQLKNSADDVTIADLGCGEAKIAQNVRQKVFSFDLVPKNDFVTAADMAKVPLDSGSIDIAIFCLSLMGVNVSDFLKEAKRLLKPGGILKIAEVVSRIENLHDFVEAICSLGFKLNKKDESNKMFVLLDFEKAKEHKRENVSCIKLKPCIYKRR